MVQFLFTPWRHRGELLLVRAQFYPHRCQRSNEEGGDRDSADRLQRQRQRRQDHQSSRASGRLSSNFGGGDGDGKDTDGRQQAVDRVSMWMQRGGCPHLVESTAVLTAAALSDEEFMSRAGSDWSGWRSYEVRLAYSTAFGRFVTGLLDTNQDRQRKMSMYAVAKSVGLPAAFVELRHQATHEALPSLTKLRDAADKALGWIWEYYWQNLQPVHEAGAATRDPSGTVLQQAVGPGGDFEDSRAELMGCLQTEDESVRKKQLDEALHKWGEERVLTTLHGITEKTTDTQVLRGAMKLVREVMGVEKLHEGDGREVVRDLERVKAELGEAWEELRQAKGAMGASSSSDSEKMDDDTSERQEVEAHPSWALYPEEDWVPRPIGVV